MILALSNQYPVPELKERRVSVSRLYFFAVGGNTHKLFDELFP